MVTTVIITATSRTTFSNGGTATASASISGSTNQTTMSQEQKEEMQCALLPILSNATPTPSISNNRTKDIPDVLSSVTVSYK